MKNLNETRAEVVALNVINDEKFVEINGNRIERKEYNGVPILTPWDIGKIHSKDVKAVNQQFLRNKDRFKEKIDYFPVSREEIQRSQIVAFENFPKNVKRINFYTERGYLKLTKTFSDDFSWKVQDILIDNYFGFKILKKALEDGEIEIVQKSQPKSYSPSEYELTNQKIEMMKAENEKEKLKLDLGNSFERLADIK